MAKPIVLLGYPNDQPRGEMEELTRDLQRYLHDYHVLVFPERGIDFTFDVYNHENHDTTSVKKIKEYIDKHIKQ